MHLGDKSGSFLGHKNDQFPQLPDRPTINGN